MKVNKLVKISVLVATMVGLTGCSVSNSTESTTETKETTVSETIESLEEEQLTQSEKEDIVEEYLTTKLKLYDIDFDREEKVIRVGAKDKSALLILTEIENDPEVAENWDIIATNFEHISGVISDMLGNGYYINFVNPYDDEKTLLLILDGEIYYNFTEDL